MPFVADNFVTVGGQMKAGNAPQIFSYQTTDAAATVDTSGYFNAVNTILKPGDIIFRTTFSGANPSTAGMHLVMSVSAAGVVDVSDTTALTVTNTD
jgi:hypothetical protein